MEREKKTGGGQGEEDGKCQLREGEILNREKKRLLTEGASPFAGSSELPRAAQLA